MKFRKLNKKGVMGLSTAKEFVLGILLLAVIAFAVVIAMGELADSRSVNDAGYNETTAIMENVSQGTASFFENAGTWFALLAVVIIILIIAVVIIATTRFGGVTTGATGL